MKNKFQWWFKHHIQRYVSVCFGGMLIGFAAVLFVWGSNTVESISGQMYVNYPHLIWILPALGFALIAAVNRSFFGNASSGVPNVFAAYCVKEERLFPLLLNQRMAIGLFVLTLASIFVGASLGREAPTVLIGAVILSSFAYQNSTLERHNVILAGGAAGLAAAFNAPFAGLVFAMEAMHMMKQPRNEHHGFLLAVIVVAGITAMLLTGNTIYFEQQHVHLTISQTIIAVLLSGVFCGVLGGLFNLVAVTVIRSRHKIPLLHTHPVLFAGICGLSIGLIGYLAHGSTFGSGYAFAHQIVQQGAVNDLSFGICKFLATMVSYVSGIPGGVLAPSLSVGAGLGANVATWMGAESAVSAISILAMVAYFSAAGQTPLTAFVIMLELTHNFELAIPMMFVATFSHVISRCMCRKSFYFCATQALIEKVQSI